MKKVRITVVYTDFNRDLVDRYMTPEKAKTFGPCGYEIGESHVVGQPVQCPEGMCPWAWHDIESFVRIAAFGGKADDYVPAGAWIRSCTDAMRPVTFLIEPLDEDDED